MNNFQKIKAMNIDEMAKLFYDMTFNDFCCNEGCTAPARCQGNPDECKDGIKQWLESEEE